MTKEEKRFNRIELNSILRVFKKKDRSSKRFDYLEINGLRVNLPSKDQSKKLADVICPKCQNKNQAANLYCSYCGVVFSKTAAENLEINIEAYQKKCIHCDKTVARTQEICNYCGCRLLPKQPDPMMVGDQEQGNRNIVLNIDGKLYHSTDKKIPPDVAELMSKIKKEGYSQKTVDDWVNKRNSQIENQRKEEAAQTSRIFRSAMGRILVRIIILVICILFFTWLMGGNYSTRSFLRSLLRMVTYF